MKVRFIMLLLACAMMAGAAQAQTAQSGQDTDAYDRVEVMPEYPGGMGALFQYLGDNVAYPKTAQEAGIGGRVLVAFVIDREGNVVEPAIAQSIDPALDAEALRVVKAMPRWTPGKQDGKTVRVKFTLPIQFNPDKGATDAKTDGK